LHLTVEFVPADDDLFGVREGHDDAPEPLAPDEERLWRAVNRLLFVLPKALDQDLQKLTGLNSSRYGILFNLSEAPDRTLRMPGHLHSARRRVMSQVAESGIDVASLTRLMERIVKRSETP
jgi:DNA-binding MarR family transcriptional regulator